jgi:hypothetical protein
MEKKERAGSRAHAFVPDVPAWDLRISLYTRTMSRIDSINV